MMLLLVLLGCSTPAPEPAPPPEPPPAAPDPEPPVPTYEPGPPRVECAAHSDCTALTFGQCGEQEVALRVDDVERFRALQPETPPCDALIEPRSMPLARCRESVCTRVEPRSVLDEPMMRACSTAEDCATVVTDCCGTQFAAVNTTGRDFWEDDQWPAAYGPRAPECGWDSSRPCPTSPPPLPGNACRQGRCVLR